MFGLGSFSTEQPMVLLLILLFYFIPIAIAAEWVYRDAKKNSTQSATMWSIIVLLFFLLGLLLYLLTGRDLHESNNKSGHRCQGCGAGIGQEDEFCSSCGAEVERVECEKCGAPTNMGADFCSECGNDLREYPPQETTIETLQEITTDDKIEPKLSVSTSWWYYGVLGGGGVWILYFVLSIILPMGTYVTWGILAIGSLIIPVCLYLDSQYVLSNTEWNPKNVFLMAVLGIVPYLNIVVAAGYLYQRHTELGEPSVPASVSQRFKNAQKSTWVIGIFVVLLILVFGGQFLTGLNNANSLQGTQLETAEIRSYMDPMDRPRTPSAYIEVDDGESRLSITGFMGDVEYCKTAEIRSAQYKEEDSVFILNMGTLTEDGETCRSERGRLGAYGTMVYNLEAEFEGGTPSRVEIHHDGEKALEIPRSEYS